jgi:indole-3-glycerol phosphate synthase
VSTVLDGILATTREDVDRRRADRPLPAQASHRPANLCRDALAAPGLSIIAEHKRRSPSAGQIGHGLAVGEIATAYERGGASAISVLTEERSFGGSLKDLRAARAAVSIPIIRKDFVIDSYQLAEAVDAGADAVLLIVAALGPQRLAQLHADAVGVGLGVLVEVHDADELELALEIRPAVIGINNRDLRDFSVDVGRTLALAPLIPEPTIIVSESGLDSPASLARLRDVGIHAALVGEALMRSAEPGTTLRQLLAQSIGNS